MNNSVLSLSVLLFVALLAVVGLILLIGNRKLIRRLVDRQITEPATFVSDGHASVANRAGQEVTPEVLAAITAAIATVWQGDTGFVVRHVRRVNNAPAWNRAGREDQTYSRM